MWTHTKFNKKKLKKILTIAYSTNAIKHVRKELNPFTADISIFSDVENITRACDPWEFNFLAR